MISDARQIDEQEPGIDQKMASVYHHRQYDSVYKLKMWQGDDDKDQFNSI